MHPRCEKFSARAPGCTFEQILVSSLFQRSHHEDADQSIGNDFFDFGGGNSRSSSAKSSLVNFILREPALS